MVLPEVSINSEALYRMVYAPIRTKLLLTAIELRVFNLLEKAASADQVATGIEGHSENTRIFLNGLAACGLLVKKNGMFQNTPLSQNFLVHGEPTYLGEGFVYQAAMCDAMLGDLGSLVKNGPPPPAPQDALDDEEKWGDFAAWLGNNERAGTAQQMAALVAGLPEFPSCQKMLDLGGGPGLFCIAMVGSHPAMKGVVFDLKPVVNVARAFVEEYGMSDRIEVLAGDYNCDPIGGGYDLIWASATLNFARQNMAAVMQKIYAALNPKGLFINLSEGLTHEGTKPDFYVLSTMPWAMTSPIRPFDQGEIADAMLNAGFRSVRSKTVSTGWGVMDLDIARK